MSFVTIIKKIGKVFSSPATAKDAALAGTVVSAFNPGLGSLIESVANTVYSVEVAAPAGTTGTDKKAAVQGMIDLSAPATLQILQQISGKPIPNASAVAPTLDKIIDDIVAMFNDLGIFQHATSTPAPAPPKAS